MRKLVVLFLLAGCAGNSSGLDSKVYDGQYVVDIWTTMEKPVTVGTRVDIMVREDGAFDFTNHSGYIPAPSEIRAVPVVDGKVLYAVKSERYETVMTGIVSGDALDLTIHDNIRERSARVAGEPRQVNNMEVLDGFYIIEITNHNMVCDGSEPVERNTWIETVELREHQHAISLHFEGGVVLNIPRRVMSGSNADGNGAFFVPVMPGYMADPTAYISGLLSPAKVEVKFEVELWWPYEGCIETYKLSGMKRISGGLSDDFTMHYILSNTCTDYYYDGYGQATVLDLNTEVIRVKDRMLTAVINISENGEFDDSFNSNTYTESISGKISPPVFEYEYFNDVFGKGCMVALVATGHARHVKREF
jgi:hypothetical protein